MNILKNFSNSLKSKIGKDILSLFDNIEYTEKSFTCSELACSNLFAPLTKIETDDSFAINYKNSEILFSDVKLYTRTSKGEILEFCGLVLSFDIKKRFNGVTVVSEKNDSLFKPFSYVFFIFYIVSLIIILTIFLSDPSFSTFIKFFSYFICVSFAIIQMFKKNPFKKVDLEDPEFDKKFDVYSTGSQVEARYLLTPAFMYRYKTLKNVFGNKPIKCSFYANKIMLSIFTTQNLFEIGSIYKTLKSPKPFYKFYSQISAIFDMIEHLKMYDETPNNK